jgi:hypothetical protein
MTTIRGSHQRQGGGAGSFGGGGGGRTVDVRQLDAESQRAHELLKALSDLGDVVGRRKIIAKAGATEPLTPRALSMIAQHLARLDMPLTPAGIARFKADRGLVGGNALAGPVARAYARAVDGGEVLFRIDRKEELELRPADKAALDFLRQLARSAGAEAVGRLKEALGLGNPPTSSPEAQALMNEYVGIHTVREVARVTTLHRVALTSEAVKGLVEKLEAEKAEKAEKAEASAASTPTTSTKPKAKTQAPSSASTPAASIAAAPTSEPSRDVSSRPGPIVPGRGLRRG